ncbi:MAG: hypothetical protein K2X27_26500 [Candidatus Obscuribacterales bacterium]|nr:hypothetical protein [Candidatus Obscuribacterales bacterium]
MSQEKNEKQDLLYALSRNSRCYGCDRKLLVDEIVRLTKMADESEVFCLECAGLKKMAVLRKGNAKVTRLAKKYSDKSYIIVKWSDAWKCYERQGLLVEAEALSRASKEADEN